METFLRIIKGASASESTQVLFIVMLIMFGIAIWGQWTSPQNRKAKLFANSAPTTIVAVGIFGTFLGVFLGLLDFDIRDIDESIPELLEGLKIAFVSSVMGLFFSIVLRITQPFSGKIDDIESESREFSEMLSDSMSQALLDELRDVIRDFNAKMSEQFGENFKELNEAVGKQLEWQKQNKAQMEELRELFERTVETLEKTEMSITRIKESLAEIPDHLEKMENAHAILNQAIGKMDESQKSLILMQESAEKAFPAIEEKIKSLVDVMENVAPQVRENMETEINDAMQKIANNLGGMAQQFSEDYESALQEIRRIAEIGRRAQDEQGE